MALSRVHFPMRLGTFMADVDFDLLRKMPVFGGLSDTTLQLICGQSQSVDLPAGAYFFHEGDRARSLFVIQQGSVEIERCWQGGKIVLGHLKRGDCFGEMALIDLRPRSASVRAIEDCRTLEITAMSLHNLYRQELEQYAIIMLNMGREVSRRLRVADDRLFELEQRMPILSL
jgi:CRP/FNR family transcriptional regulator, cyclic AMP receptor protein